MYIKVYMQSFRSLKELWPSGCGKEYNETYGGVVVTLTGTGMGSSRYVQASTKREPVVTQSTRRGKQIRWQHRMKKLHNLPLILERGLIRWSARKKMEDR